MIRATDGENAANIAEFSISLFVCLLMLSAYTLNARFILVSMVLAIIFEQILEGYSSGIGPGGWVFSPVVLGLATWICVFAGRSRLELIETVVQANARRARLQRYFSPGVGELLEEQEADTLARGKDCELTIIFIDIRGFTSLSEQLSTREVVELLNSYHAHMVEAIFRHGGTLDKYLGDGLIAYFNAPVDQPDHAERAVACAFEMERRLIMFNEERSKEGKVTIKMGIGVHTGRAIVGDIGAPHRREFTAIGSAVNEASRLEGMTKELKRSMVVSEATAQLVTDVPWDELGRYPIRGRVEPLLLFAPKKS
jgi:adenylate cyclase